MRLSEDNPVGLFARRGEACQNVMFTGKMPPWGTVRGDSLTIRSKCAC